MQKQEHDTDMQVDGDELSDVSDNSDLFHVEVMRDKDWTTEQDVELDRIDRLA